MTRTDGPIQSFGLPISLDGARPARVAPAPPLGQDNDWLEELLLREE